jgi:hypothetical protein
VKWTKEEEDLLRDAVLKGEGTMQERFQVAAEQTGHSAGSCGARWYRHLGVLHDQALQDSRTERMRRKKSSKTRMKRRSDAWTTTEDDLMMRTLLQVIANGELLDRAWERIAAKLKRTKAAVKFHWYETLRYQDVDAIEAAYASRKEKLIEFAHSPKEASFHPWTTEDERMLVQCVLDAARRNQSQVDGIRDAARRLHRTFDACSQRWHRQLKWNYQHQERIARGRTPRIKGVGHHPNDAWTEYEEKVLRIIVRRYDRNGYTRAHAFDTAAKHLGRTSSSCQARWHKLTVQWEGRGR